MSRSLRCIRPIFFTLFVVIFFPSLDAHAQLANQETHAVYLYQTVQENECALREVGDGTNPDAMVFMGKHSESDPQIYRCAVEIPMQEFSKKLGVCTLGGQNYSAGYNFFKGDPRTRTHSCNSYPLKNGNFYFYAEGIDQDSCNWICFPSGLPK